MVGESATNDVDEAGTERLEKLQLVIDEQSPMQIKPDSLIFLEKRKLEDAARMAHNATHVPFRDWCPICVVSRGRSSPHRRVVVNKTAVAESKTQPCVTFVETRSGVVISFMSERWLRGSD